MLKVFNRTKLDPPYRGPFLVTEAMPPNYELEVNGRKRVFHGEHLKLFLRRGDIDYVDTRLLEPEEATEDESEDEEETPDPDPDCSLEQQEEGEPEDNQEDDESQAVQGGRVTSQKPVFKFLPTASSSARNIRPNPRYM